MRSRFLIVLSLTLLVVLAAGEGAGRALGFGHPLLYQASSAGYELRPDQAVKRLGATTHINALGTRGPSASLFPAPDTLRILSLGDSVANGGTRIDDAETYPIRLQANLRAQKHRVEVLNASAGGWAPGNEAAWLQEHGLLGAKILVLEINDHDLDQRFVDSSILDTNISFPSHPPATAIGEIFTRYLIPRLGFSVETSDPGSKDSDFIPENTPFVLNDIRNTLEKARQNQVRTILLFWDSRTPATPQRTAARDALMQLATSLSVPVVRPDLAARTDAATLFADTIHPNAKGNVIIAKMLTDVIDALLAKTPPPTAGKQQHGG